MQRQAANAGNNTFASFFAKSGVKCAARDCKGSWNFLALKAPGFQPVGFQFARRLKDIECGHRVSESAGADPYEPDGKQASPLSRKLKTDAVDPEKRPQPATCLFNA